MIELQNLILNIRSNWGNSNRELQYSE